MFLSFKAIGVPVNPMYVACGRLLRSANLYLASLGIDLLLETILPAVRLVRHDDDVVTLGKRLMRLLELLHGGENDAIRLPAVEQLFQVLTALRVDRVLTQEVLALGELAVKLVVQIVPVSNDNDGR